MPSTICSSQEHNILCPGHSRIDHYSQQWTHRFLHLLYIMIVLYSIKGELCVTIPASLIVMLTELSLSGDSSLLLHL